MVKLDVSLIPWKCKSVSCSVVSDSLWPRGLLHAKPPCRSPTPRAHSTHVHWVGDAVHPSHPVVPFPPTFNLSQHRVFHIRWPKYWSFSFSISPSNEHPGLISFRMDWLALLAVQGTLKSLLQHTVQKHQFFHAQLSLWSNSHIHTWLLEKPKPWPDGLLLAKQWLCFLTCCLGWS